MNQEVNTGADWTAASSRLSLAEAEHEELIAANQSTPRVFISYSREQFYFAESLAIALKVNGIEVWFDAHDALPGTNWTDALAKGINKATAVILVGSRSALSSQDVRDEISIATAKAKPIFIAAFESIELPDDLAHYPIIDFRRHFNRGLGNIKAALEGQRVGIARQTLAKSELSNPVRTIATALALQPFLFLPLFVWISVSYPSPLVAIVDIYAILLSCVLFYLARNFLRRNFRRFEVALALIFSSIGLPSAAILVSTTSGIEDALLLGFVYLAPLIVIPFIAVAMTMLYGSGVIYRWLPTGMARESERRFGKKNRSLDSHSRPNPSIPTFCVHHNPIDSRVASVVRKVFLRAGWHVHCTKQKPDLDIVMVSTATKVAHELEECCSVRPPLIVITSNGVADEQLELLSRIQWIDFRRRAKRQLSLAARLLAGQIDGGAVDRLRSVPERLNRRIVPPHVDFILFLSRFCMALPATFGLCMLIVVLPLLIGTHKMDWTMVAIGGGMFAVLAALQWISLKWYRWLVGGLLQRRFSVWAVVYSVLALLLIFVLDVVFPVGSKRSIDSIFPIMALALALGEGIWPWLPAASTHFAVPVQFAHQFRISSREVLRSSLLHFVLWFLPLLLLSLFYDENFRALALLSRGGFRPEVQ